MARFAFVIALLVGAACITTSRAAVTANTDIVPPPNEIGVGESVQLEAIGGNGAPRWSSDNSSIAAVNASGLLTGMAAGQTTIRVRRGSQSAFASVQVIIRFPSLIATYYVRTDGNDTNNGRSNTAAGAWRTIDWAADHVLPGSVVRVQAGTYSETATPGVSGTTGNTVTLVADGAVTTCGMTVSNKSYIRVIGFTMDPSTAGCTADSTIVNIVGTNTGLEFWNNTFQNTDANAFLADIGERCHSCIILGGSFQHINDDDPVTGKVALGITGNDWYIGSVEFSGICYLALSPSGNRVRIVGNYFHDMVQCLTTHPDNVYPHGLSVLGYSTSLMESNYGVGTPTASDNKWMHVQPQASDGPCDCIVDFSDDVFRQNVAYNMGSAYYSVYSYSAHGLINRFRFYNETIVNMAQALNQSDPQYTAAGNISSQNGNLSASLYNNIYVNGWTEAARTSGGVGGWSAAYAGSTITNDYNLMYDTRGSLTNFNSEAHPQNNVNPLFVSSGTDFTLQSGSGARGTGGPLTTANGSGSSSTSLTVASNTGSLFIGSNAGNLPQYGGALVPGDVITVGSTTVQVSSVSGDTLTLATAISWSNGDPVYFGSSTTIDIGAYPYKAGGYSLSASYSCSAGTCTTTPSDASLVRFVICYNDGVPYSVDNATPYTCADPSGAFESRVYPRYASTTRWAVATP